MSLVFWIKPVLSMPMPEQWFLRVEDREYGPADLTMLHEWKEDGRVLRENEARLDGSDAWIQAAEIPGLFAPDLPVPPKIVSDLPSPVSPSPGFFRICFDTLALYIRGFFPYLGLTLLVVVPSILSQLTAAMLAGSSGVDESVRTLLGGAFSFCMLLLTMLAWPLYITGIQILTANLARNERISFFEVLNRSLRFWPRVAILCLIVYFSLAFWTLLPMAVILVIASGGLSPFSAVAILGVSAVQVWVFSRLFINFLFWQQSAVLEENDVSGALRRSKTFARSRHELPWYQRPLWQGVLVSSLWVLLLMVLSLPTLLPAFHEYWRLIWTTQNPQTLIEAMTKASQGQGLERLNFALWLVEKMLQPLVGIAFVLIFLAARSAESDKEA
jgi:hypothetical protein